MNSSRAWFIGLVLASFAGLIALAQRPGIDRTAEFLLAARDALQSAKPRVGNNSAGSSASGGENGGDDLVKLDLSHPIFHSFYDIDTLKMAAPYGEFVPQFWGMTDENGKIQLIANYNNDLGDYWKYLDHGEKPLKDSSRSIRFGVNYIVYAMSH